MEKDFFSEGDKKRYFETRGRETKKAYYFSERG